MKTWKFSQKIPDSLLLKKFYDQTRPATGFLMATRRGTETCSGVISATA
jgi:hypothetical protein